ncbi:MAG TPA: short-chain dehydrogenase, partial [Paracoccaceae bacterium]|nr:short-chain dehydrogenase [Paracoccaceae bacterium]
ESSPRRDFYHSKVRQRLYDESGNKGTFDLGAEAVSAKLVHALESRKPHARYFVTTPTYIANLMRRLLPTRLLDKILSRQ